MRLSPAEFLSGRSNQLRLSLALSFAAIGHGRVAAAPNELGHPVVREFAPGKSQIGHLCQAVTQDAAGMIYMANGAVARSYDGAAWRFIALPTESAGIRKFATTAD